MRVWPTYAYIHMLAHPPFKKNINRGLSLHSIVVVLITTHTGLAYYPANTIQSNCFRDLRPGRQWNFEFHS